MQDDSLAELFERHHARLHAFIRLRASPIVLANESSSDLTQSVCREAIARSAEFRYQGDDRFMGWLATIALAKLVDRQRFYSANKRNLGKKPPSLDALAEKDESLLAATYSDFETPSKSASHREQVVWLELAMAELTDDHREVITLARILQLPHSEVAARMGRREDAVRQLLARALTQLAGALVAARRRTGEASCHPDHEARES